ncbi:PHP domain-containing protein [Candidatus Woesearchaeota archaeon]|nr:PHP domain-containing protein [Candidatus Woesearchaeota archaeon]MCF7900833.1 PHP domain-containing protein [Candidatus Woesearchaeota archaeon]MCF8014068.1 PHP domain-containing protein [Candidatus Woesearchaeota archaeon]
MNKIIYGNPNYHTLEKNNLVVDMHSHTEASHDCVTKLKDYATRTKDLGIGIAITDHDEIKGSVAFKKRYPKSFLIPGIEVTSINNKHILMYFNKISELEEFFKKNVKNNLKQHKTNAFRIRTKLETEELIDKSKEQNGISIFAHPMILSEGIYGYMKSKKDYSLLKKITGIEAINSTQTIKENLKSTEWTQLEKKPFTGGSDSHILATLGNTVTISTGNTVEDFLEKIRKKQNHVIGHSNKWYNEMKSLATIMRNKLKKNQ